MDILDPEQFVILTTEHGQYRVGNRPERIDQVKKLLDKPPRSLSGAEYFARQYSEQTRLNATDKQREATLQALQQSGDMWIAEDEPEALKVPYFDIPVFRELLAA